MALLRARVPAHRACRATRAKLQLGRSRAGWGLKREIGPQPQSAVTDLPLSQRGICRSLPSAVATLDIA